MFGKRHLAAPFGGRPTVALSTLALLSLAFLPALARADSSSGLQYQDAPPTVTGGTVNKDGGSSGGSSGTGSSGATKTGDGSSAKHSSAGGAKKAKGGGAGQKGSQGQGSRAGAGTPQAPGSTNTAAAVSDDGSSPLVPILIAIVVLAAISVGAVIYRRRRDPSSGAPVSPEAG